MWIPRWMWGQVLSYGEARSIPQHFVDQVERARRQRTARHLLGAFIVALIFVTYAAVFGGVTTNAVVVAFRINQVFSVLFLLISYVMARVSNQFREYLDIPVFIICVHFLVYNSMTYVRMQALCSPAMDHVQLETSVGYQASEELDCMLVSYLCLALVCHLQLLGGRASLALAVFAPLTWIVQVSFLGTVLTSITQVSVAYTLMCVVAVLGLRRTSDVLLTSQWEIFGLGNRKQLKAMCGLMDYLCDCTVNISSSLEILGDCPKLSALLLRAQAPNAGSSFVDLMATNTDIERFKKSLQQVAETQRPGAVLVSFRDGDNRDVQVHVYHALFEDEHGQACHTLGLVESQEVTTSMRTSSKECKLGHSAVDSDSECSSKDASDFSFVSETLSQVVASATDAGMTMAIDMDDLEIVQTSDYLKEFIGSDLTVKKQQLWQLLGSKASQKIHYKMRDMSANMSHISRDLGKIQMKLPKKKGVKYQDIFRAARCKVSSVAFFDADNCDDDEPQGEPRLLSVLSFDGLKQVLSTEKKDSTSFSREVSL